MAVQNNAISVGNNILVDTNLDLYANSITYRSISYRGYVGTVAGFSFGGANSAAAPSPGTTTQPPLGPPSPTFTLRTEIERFPFAAESSITNIGTLNTPRGNLTGHSSATHVYGAGGISSYNTPPFSPSGTVIDRFPYATPFVNSTSVGSLTGSRATSAGASGENNGFVISGRIPDTAAVTAGIDRFSFTTTPTTAVAIGSDLATARQHLTGVSGGKDGYAIGGATNAANTASVINTIWKFPYTTASRTVLVGSLTIPKLGSTGLSSITDAYVLGGITTPAPAYTYTNVIDRFPFSAEITNAFNVGTLTASKGFMSTQSSTTFGYSYGGTNTFPNSINYPNQGAFPSPTYAALGPPVAGQGLGFTSQFTVLERFPFASTSVTGASVGTLSTGKWGCTGGQY